MPAFSQMSFDPALPWNAWWALAVAGVIATALMLRRNQQKSAFPGARWLAAFLQLLALAWVLAVLANPVRHGEVSLPALTGPQVVLLDTSASMSLGGARARWQEGLDWARPLLSDGAHPTRLVTFDGSCDLSGQLPTAATGSASSLAQAIERVVAQMPDAPPPQILVVSDGVFDDPIEIERVLARVRERQIAVSTHIVGRAEEPPNLFIRKIDAPRFAATDSQVPVHVEIGMTGLPPATHARLRLLGEDGRTLAERSWQQSGELESVDLTIRTSLRSEQFTATLEAVPGEISERDNRVSFRIDPLHPKIRVFYAEGSKGPQGFGDGSLNSARFFPLAFQRSGDIDWDLFQMVEQDLRGQPLYYSSGFDDAGVAILDKSRSIPSSPEEWAQYDVIIISDIDRQMFLPHMETVRQLVAERGVGFLMNGGNHSFDTGYYDQTIWEKLIPVDCFQFGYGHGARAIGVNFPAAVRRHPILQIVPDPVLNDRILNCHPRLRGFHDIRRVKPGATTLATVESNGAPLIAVQDYGRGRTMAFLSDPAGGWGEDYSGHWGPALLADESASDEVPGERALVEDATLAVNEFYNRFWVNSIRWLAAHSVRRQERTLLGRADAATARLSEKLAVSAELRLAETADQMAARTVVVRLNQGESVPLRFDRERNEFVGEVRVPENLDADELTLSFDTVPSTREYADSVTVPIVRVAREFERTTPDVAYMEDIARAGGGRVLREASEAAAVTDAARQAQGKVRLAFTQPLWDRAWFWALFVAIVGAKWWLWRASYARPASEDTASPRSSASPMPRRTARETAIHCLLAGALATTVGHASAAEPKVPSAPPLTKVARVCLIFGHPGDDAHRHHYRDLRLQLTQALFIRFGLADRDLTVFEAAGYPDGEKQSAPPARDALLTLIREAAGAARPDAAVWFVFIGHANQSRTGASFNLPGLDLTEKDLHETLETASAQGPLVFLCTQASSGRWLRALAGPQHFVLTATRPYEAENETVLPGVLASVLTAPAADTNSDGIITLREIFEACRTGVTENYQKRNFLQTETPSLDANGDGRAATRLSVEDAAAADSIGLRIVKPTTAQAP